MNKPDYVEAHSNTGTVLAWQGKLAEAIAPYRQALLIQPDHPSARANLLRAQRALALDADEAAHSRKTQETEPRVTRAR